MQAINSTLHPDLAVGIGVDLFPGERIAAGRVKEAIVSGSIRCETDIDNPGVTQGVIALDPPPHSLLLTTGIPIQGNPGFPLSPQSQ